MGCNWGVVGTVAVRKGLLRRPRFWGVPHRLAGITSDCGRVPQRLVGEVYKQAALDRKSKRLNSSHSGESRMPSSA